MNLALAHSFGILMAGMVKAVHSHLNGTIALHVEDLQRPGTSSRVTLPQIFFFTLSTSLPAQRHPALVVIKLHVLVNERANFSRSQLLYASNKCRIQGSANAVEFFLVLNLVERKDGLWRRVLRGDVAEQSEWNCQEQQNRRQRHTTFHAGISLSEEWC